MAAADVTTVGAVVAVCAKQFTGNHSSALKVVAFSRVGKYSMQYRPSTITGLVDWTGGLIIFMIPNQTHSPIGVHDALYMSSKTQPSPCTEQF